MINKDKKKRLEAIKAQLAKKYNRDVISFGSGQNIKWLRTGFATLDRLTGGGLPCGRWVMIYGPKSSGKTSICYAIMAKAQQDGKICALVDAEHTYDSVYAASFGINVDELIVNRPNTLEEAITVVKDLAGCVDIIVVDSIVAVAAESELERDLEKDTMALIPRKLSQFFRVTTPIIGKSDTCVILINQTRVDLGAFVPIERYPGGNALAHYVSFIMHVRRASKDDFPTEKRTVIVNGKEKTEDVVVGFRSKIIAEKTKVSMDGISNEGQDTFIDFFKKAPHFDKYLDLVVAAELANVIKKSGPWYVYEDKKWQGQAECVKSLKENQQLFDEIYNKVIV